MKKNDESYELLTEEYTDRLELQGKEARDTLKVMSALGRIQADRGHMDEGEAMLRECLKMSVPQFDETPPDELIHQTATDLLMVCMPFLTSLGHVFSPHPTSLGDTWHALLTTPPLVTRGRSCIRAHYGATS